mmetsp:Transcript_38616/g.77888  ORF Transcript_38616/g.77888 Transcript_38616/m.77888 type:complete len:263 (-) Transcript_38616:285-1073(-)
MSTTFRKSSRSNPPLPLRSRYAKMAGKWNPPTPFTALTLSLARNNPSNTSSASLPKPSPEAVNKEEEPNCEGDGSVAPVRAAAVAKRLALRMVPTGLVGGRRLGLEGSNEPMFCMALRYMLMRRARPLSPTGSFMTRLVEPSPTVADSSPIISSLMLKDLVKSPTPMCPVDFTLRKLGSITGRPYDFRSSGARYSSRYALDTRWMRLSPSLMLEKFAKPFVFCTQRPRLRGWSNMEAPSAFAFHSPTDGRTLRPCTDLASSW